MRSPTEDQSVRGLVGDKRLPLLMVTGVGAGVLGEERELATAPASWTLRLTITLTRLCPHLHRSCSER